MPRRCAPTAEALRGLADSAEDRLDELDDDDEDEVADGNRGEEAERRAPPGAGRRGPGPAGLRADQPRDDAADEEDDGDVEHEVQRPQVAPGQPDAAPDRDVVREVADAEDDRDDEARQDGADDRPRRVPELAPADLDLRPPARRAHRGFWPRIVSRARGGRVAGVCAASSSTV